MRSLTLRPELLFIYGTLHPDRAPAGIVLAVHTLTPIGPATISGTLLDLGHYPGVLLDSASEAQVSGHLFALPKQADEIWAQLDEYEDFRPHDQATSLFLRRETTATLTDGDRRTCWIYVYNRPRP